MHDAATARALLDAAESVVEREGIAALTVRRVAEECDTSTRAVYSSLGSKQVLLSELGVRAFELLGAAVGRQPLTDDPVADLVAAGTHGFRPFALEHPALFRVGVQQHEVPADALAPIFESAARAMVALHARIERVRDAGGLAGRSLATATWQFHASCEGLAAVELRGLIGSDEAVDLWADALGSLVAGWRQPLDGG